MLGPFKVQSNSTNNCSVGVYDKSGKLINGWTACDENGNAKGSIPGNTTFYLRFTEAQFNRGIASVKLSQSKTYKYQYKVTVWGAALYDLPGGKVWCVVSPYDPNTGGYDMTTLVNCFGHQSVYSNIFKWGTDTKTKSEETWADIEWTNFNATLDIEKVDKDNPNLKLNIEGTLRKNDGTFSKDFKMVSTPKNYKEHIDIKSAEYKLANISEFIKLIDEIKKEGFIFTSIETSSDKNHIYVNFKKGKTCFRQYLFNFADNSYEMIKD